MEVKQRTAWWRPPKNLDEREHPLMSRPAKIFLLILSLLGWLALVGQFYLIIENRVVSVPETIIRYFSFFTILPNLIVAVCCTSLMLKSASAIGNFFSK